MVISVRLIFFYDLDLYLYRHILKDSIEVVNVRWWNFSADGRGLGLKLLL